jgi:hypothetical protein
MCMVSMIIDYARDNTQWAQWDWAKYYELESIIKRLDDLDKSLGEPECKDDRKGEYLAELKSQIAGVHGAPATTEKI